MAADHPKGAALGDSPQWEGRSAIALEHIAITLEAIEGHLAQLVGASGGQGTGTQLVKELQGLKNAILQRPTR